MVISDAANRYFDRDKSVELALLVQQHGFTRIYTMCPYVTENANREVGEENIFVTQVEPHHNHFHVDYETTYNLGNRDNILKINILGYSYCSNCTHKPCPFKIASYIEPQPLNVQ